MRNRETPFQVYFKTREGQEVKYRVCYEMADGYYEMFFSEDQEKDAYVFAEWMKGIPKIYSNVEVIVR